MTYFWLDAEVDIQDGVGGEIIALAVSHQMWRLLQLLVEPKHRFGLGRLVPAEQVVPGLSHGRLELPMTEAEFDELAQGEMSYPEPGIVSGPYMQPTLVVWRVVDDEKLPSGEVGLNKDTVVRTSDDEEVAFEGVVCADDLEVTDLLVKVPHLIGHTTVAVPVKGAKPSQHPLRVAMSWDEIKALPTVHRAATP